MQIENLRFYNLSSKELLGKSGIYKLSAGGHVYVGSSKNLYARLIEHRRDLANNNHNNSFLQNVYNKYGIHDVQIDIIEYCDPDSRIQREKYWIDTLESDMNLVDPITHQFSESSLQKISNAVKQGRLEGKYKTKYDYCDVEIYDYFGNYIETLSRDDIVTKYNIPIKYISRCAAGYKKGLSIDGLRFRYTISEVPVQKFEPNPNFLGNHFVFMYIDKEGKEKYAFSSVKNCWEFLSKHLQDSEIKIIPKLRSLVKEDFPGKRGPKNSVNLETSSDEDNPNPSISEME